jgi:hypothetical protein
MRLLRDKSGAAVLFVHHEGHAGGRLRGTSDLEAFWESKVAVAKGDDGVRRVKTEHREAEAAPEFSFRLDWDETTRSMRLAAVADTLRDRVAEHLAAHPDASANAVVEAVSGNRTAVLAAVKELREQVVPPTGTTGNHRAAAPSRVVPPAPPL